MPQSSGVAANPIVLGVLWIVSRETPHGVTLVWMTFCLWRGGEPGQEQGQGQAEGEAPGGMDGQGLQHRHRVPATGDGGAGEWSEDEPEQYGNRHAEKRAAEPGWAAQPAVSTGEDGPEGSARGAEQQQQWDAPAGIGLQAQTGLGAGGPQPLVEG